MFSRNSSRFGAAAIAVFAFLLPGIASAQNPAFPATLPSNSVVGRLSVNSGPAQAIPFARFVSAITGAAAPTIGNTVIPLGQTTTTIGGLTLTNPTVNGGSLSGSFLGSVFTNGNFVSAPATTVKCNPTGASALIQDCPIASVTGNFLPALTGDGATDNCGAIGTLNSAIAALPGSSYDVKLTPGTYVVNCNITLSGVWHFMPGAILKPGSGFTITFANMPVAGTWQIFNLYNASTGTATGGTIALPQAEGTEVWGEWFGMKADNATLHNEVGMQFAINTIYPFAGASGGFVRLGSGVFLMCGSYEVINSVTIKGMGRSTTELLANPSCWNGSPNMAVFFNSVGTKSQFGCWTEDLEFNANSIAAITSVIDASSWQEDSGLKRVLLLNFMGNGIIDINFFGGAADINLEDVEIFASPSATGLVNGVLLQSPLIQNWTNLNVNRLVFSADKPSLGNEVGFALYGRINANVTGIHFEQCAVGFDLNDRANLTGNGINGGPGAGVIVQVSAFANPQNANERNLTGTTTQISRVGVHGLILGGATTLFHDAVNSTTTTDKFAFPFIYP